ncbi:hypothetical protein [Flavobacterium gossypii]|nr:hypothetical protein [Flavobacterium gossypii]
MTSQEERLFPDRFQNLQTGGANLLVKNNDTTQPGSYHVEVNY